VVFLFAGGITTGLVIGFFGAGVSSSSSELSSSELDSCLVTGFLTGAMHAINQLFKFNC